MSSIGEDAYVGTLHYQTLDPPVSVSGGVQNPMDADLNGGGFAITNTSAITTGTLNYTTLNPPLPTSGVDNPMTSSLDAGNFNIANVADITATTVNGGSGSITNNFVVGGSITGGSGLITTDLGVGGILTTNSLTATGGAVLPNAGVIVGIPGNANLDMTGSTANFSNMTDIQLGTDRADRGNSGLSRAFVKDNNSTLAINFSGDYTGGTTVQGDNLTVAGTLITTNTPPKYGTGVLGSPQSPSFAQLPTQSINMTGSTSGYTIYLVDDPLNPQTLQTTVFDVETGVSFITQLYNIVGEMSCAISGSGVGAVVDYVQVEPNNPNPTRFFITFQHSTIPKTAGQLYRYKIMLIN